MMTSTLKSLYQDIDWSQPKKFVIDGQELELNYEALWIRSKVIAYSIIKTHYYKYRYLIEDFIQECRIACFRIFALDGLDDRILGYLKGAYKNVIGSYFYKWNKKQDILSLDAALTFENNDFSLINLLPYYDKHSEYLDILNEREIKLVDYLLDGHTLEECSLMLKLPAGTLLKVVKEKLAQNFNIPYDPQTDKLIYSDKRNRRTIAPRSNQKRDPKERSKRLTLVFGSLAKAEKQLTKEIIVEPEKQEQPVLSKEERKRLIRRRSYMRQKFGLRSEEELDKLSEEILEQKQCLPTYKERKSMYARERYKDNIDKEHTKRHEKYLKHKERVKNDSEYYKAFCNKQKSLRELRKLKKVAANG